MTRVRQVRVPDLKPDDWQIVKRGTPLLDTMPDTPGPVVLSLNGQFLLRAHWPKRLKRNDQVEWFVDQPQDREAFRTVLMVAAVVAAIIPGLQGFAPYLAAASVAYNLLVPPTVVQQPNDPARAVYNASLNGNAARLDQPIWRTCGVDRINPPFASRPYYEYNDAGDQYYFAVFAVGYGPHDVLGEFIGKTPIGSYSDVLTHAYLPPGVQPSHALANVVTSDNVTGMELETGRFVGGFIASNAGQLASSIGLDLFAPQGLGKPATEDSDDTTVTIAWQFEYQQVNDAGAPIGDWTLLTNGSKTASTNTPVRFSIKVPLATPMRVQVRGARANLANTNANARDGFQWAGLRAYLSNPAPLNASTAHYEVVMRASEQLSAQSQTDFSLMIQGKCRTWNPTDGWNCALYDFDNYVASRNPADWLGDLCTDGVWGEGLPDSRVDLQTLYELGLTWATRQDRIDYTFAATTDAWTAGQLIASAGRARMFRRYGVRSWARDELAELGETALTPRICIGEMQMNEIQPKTTDPDGVIVEYVSNVTWDKLTIECPCPGVTEITRPIYIPLDGVKGAKHAQREGLYHAADMALRNRTVTAKTEMQALVASFMLPVRWLPQIPGYGQTGDVAFWDAGTLVMGLTEKPDWSAGDLWLTLKRDNGSITTPVRVFPGPTVWDVQLPSAPDFEIITKDGLRERPVFLLGPLTTGDELVKISNRKDGGKSDNGAQYFDIEAVVDDPRVHAADNALLPGPGDIQDPIGLPGDSSAGEGGGGTLVLVTLQDHTVVDGQIPIGGGISAGIYLNNDGTFQTFVGQGSVFTAIPGQWLLVPVEPSIAAGFEVLAHANIDTSVGFVGSDLFDTWLSLGTTRHWTTTVGSYAYVTVNLQIRKVGDTVLQASRTMILQVNDVYEGSG